MLVHLRCYTCGAAVRIVTSFADAADHVDLNQVAAAHIQLLECLGCQLVYVETNRAQAAICVAERCCAVDGAHDNRATRRVVQRSTTLNFL